MEDWAGLAKTIVVGVDGKADGRHGDGRRRQGNGVANGGDDSLVGMAEIDAEQEQVVRSAGWGIEQVAIEAKRDREHHGYGVSRTGRAGELLEQLFDREAVEISTGQELVGVVGKDAGLGIEHQEYARQGEQWPVAASTKRLKRGIDEVGHGALETVSGQDWQGVVHGGNGERFRRAPAPDEVDFGRDQSEVGDEDEMVVSAPLPRWLT